MVGEERLELGDKVERRAEAAHESGQHEFLICGVTGELIRDDKKNGEGMKKQKVELSQ
jgi:hypothetical protein